jgi:hypothetical protein
MRFTRFMPAVALVALAALAGCRSGGQTAQDTSSQSSSGSSHNTNDLSVPPGTTIEVTLETALTSETASVGTPWSGTIRAAVVFDGRNVIPAGSSANGTVTSVTPARKGDRAMLDLGLSTILVNGRNYRVRGGMESIVAGSPRARNLGAIGAATAVGAVVGHAIGGSGKGTLIGAVVGGGAAAGAVSQTKGWQVVLKVGTPLTFTTSEAVAVRL